MPLIASADAAPPRMVAAALSAAVTSAKLIGDEPHSQGAQAERKDQLESSYSSGGSAREGLLLEKPPPSQPASAALPRMVAAALSAAVTSAKLIGDEPHSQGAQAGRKDQLESSYSSGGSAREGLLLEKPPPSHTPTIPASADVPLPPHGRGGSVSRRDLSQAYRRRTALAGSASWEERPTRIQLLFGRGPGGGASLREAASPGVPPRSFYWRFYEFYAFAFAYGV